MTISAGSFFANTDNGPLRTYIALSNHLTILTFTINLNMNMSLNNTAGSTKKVLE